MEHSGKAHMKLNPPLHMLLNQQYLLEILYPSVASQFLF